MRPTVAAVMRHVHSSSRFDRSWQTLLRFVLAVLAGADVITLTEVARDTRVKHLRRIPGWLLLQAESADGMPPGADECAVLIRTSKWRLLSIEPVLLTNLEDSRGRVRTYSLNVALQHKRTLQRVVVSVAHLPAHFQLGDGHLKNASYRAWVDAVASWQRNLAAARAKGFEVVQVADWNADAKNAAWAARIAEVTTGLRSSWLTRKRPLANVWTHRHPGKRGRLIDDTYSTLQLRRIDLLPVSPSSDHRPYREVLVFPLRAVKPVRAPRFGTPTGRVVRNMRRRGVTVIERTGRKGWGTRHESLYQKRRRLKPAHRPADTVVAHITVTRRSGDPRQDARVIEQIGIERFATGWSYNLGIDMATGVVLVGQPLDAKGAHTLNDKKVPGFSRDQNLMARAIAFVGMPGDELSDAARHSFVQALAAMMDEGEVTPDPDLVPHSLFAFKDCPTNAVRSVLPAVLADAHRAAA